MDEQLDVEKRKYWLLLPLYAVCPVIAFYLMEAYEHNPFVEVRFQAQWLNIILFELIAWALYFFIGRMHIAVRVLFALSMVFGLINHYVMVFRSTPFVPWDIFSVSTAASVAGNYDFTPNARVVTVTGAFIILMALAHFLKKVPRISWKIGPVSGILVTLVLCLFVRSLQNEDFQTKHYLYPFLFTPVYMTQVNGMAVTFAMNLAYVVVDKPQGYSAKEAQEILDSYEYETEDISKDAEMLPNIIVVMDEAFSDLAGLGNLETNKDYMPFMHKMQQGQENTITGYAQVSVCGGNTANSEFEFLTGNTMAFLPGGSIPYQQYIKKETPSMASYLKSLGYVTYAQHPYHAGGWNRDTVYPLLGFENMDFLPDYVGASYVRKYVSDASDIQHIIDTYEKKESGKPMFLFNVTMQNHGGYTEEYSDFTNEITASQHSEALNQYLSLIYQSDQALENLISYFSDVKEPTVVVFFGDHQPSDAVASVVAASFDDPTRRYQVPYLIWANYDIEEKTGCNTSLNYLSAQVLSTAGVQTNAYQNFLLELRDVYPSLSAAGQQQKGKNDEKLTVYQKLQYYQLFEGNQ